MPSLALLLLASLLFVASSLSNFPIVRTSYGSVRGYEYRAKIGFVGEIFKKIPYASPPTGSRRWKKPAPPEPWNYTLDGTFFGPACAQHPSFWEGYVTGFSEDCLTLNVYTSRGCRESNSSCPIVVYIHGGNALYEGTMKFPDETLITNFASQGIIMVTVAFRLGIFGILALGDENVVPANLAIHDVLEGLRFTRNEIHNFGGDKDQISVMGHSTGATIATLLAFSPGISRPGETPLFARAISMSFSPVIETEKTQVQRSHSIASKLGCEGSARQIINCLLPLSTDTLINATFDEKRNSAFTIADIILTGELMPITNVKELYQNHKPIKLMVGTTLFEMGAFGPDTSLSKAIEFDKKTMDNNITHVNAILGIENNKECTEKYFNDKQSGEFESRYTLFSQASFMGSWMFANSQGQAGVEVYLYSYDYPAHALHTDDAYYVMGFHEHPVDANEKWLSRVYPVYFANFIKGLPLAPDWKPVNPEFMNYYSVNKSITEGIEPRMKLGYHRTISDYYKDMMAFDKNLSTMKEQVLNWPVEYRNQTLRSSDPFNLRDFLFYLAILIVILYIAFKIYHLFRSRREERSGEERPLVTDIEE